MPCFTRQASTIEWGAATDVALLVKAMQAQGFTVTVVGKIVAFGKMGADDTMTSGRYTEGTMTVDGPVDQNALKRAYSAQVVTSAAQRFGWTVKQPAENQFQVTRRF